LLMPDHLHMLIGIPSDAKLSNLIRDFKRITTQMASITWQRNLFDHRLRHGESENEKVAYIRANPIGAGLIPEHVVRPYAINSDDLNEDLRARRTGTPGDRRQSPLPEVHAAFCN